MKTKAEEWAERVRAWRESGQTAAAFASGKGFTEYALRWWKGELERRARQRAPRLAMARVVRAPDERMPLVVAVGAARIEVRAGFDRTLFREVVEVLGGTR